MILDIFVKKKRWKKIIRLIENRYDELVSNCLKFYDKTDMDNIVEEILR